MIRQLRTPYVFSNSQVNSGRRLPPLSWTVWLTQNFNFERVKQHKEARIMPLSYGDWVEARRSVLVKRSYCNNVPGHPDDSTNIVYWRLLWEGHPIHRMLFYGNNLQARNWSLNSPGKERHALGSARISLSHRSCTLGIVVLCLDLGC